MIIFYIHAVEFECVFNLNNYYYPTIETNIGTLYTTKPMSNTIFDNGIVIVSVYCRLNIPIIYDSNNNMMA